MAGVSRLQYRTDIRLIRVMCSGRVDLAFVLRAFSNGMDGVFLGGCRLGECNYITQGNYDALGMVYLCKKILAHTGIDPERLRIAFMSSGEGILFTQVVNEFGNSIKELGPLGSTEGMDLDTIRFKLKAAQRLVPYLKLVERERLRIPVKSEAAYREFYTGQEFERLFEELIAPKLAIGQIVSLLGERPLSTGEIAESLHFNPSEVARYMESSSRQGLVRFDQEEKRFALA